VQLTHEFINPGWPAATINQMTRRMKKALQETGVRVTSGMTGPYGRLNHFGHPDASVRRYYIDWFKTFADITAELVVIRWARSSPFLPCEIIRISPAATR
jgi:lysophospholipase L1-like esterase